MNMKQLAHDRREWGLAFLARHRRLQDELAGMGNEGIRCLAAALISLGTDRQRSLSGALRRVRGNSMVWSLDSLLGVDPAAANQTGWCQKVDGQYVLVD